MSRQGLKIAVKYGLKRRRFSDLDAAHSYYKSLKENVFEITRQLDLEYPKAQLDYSPTSLKAIEKIYFDYFDQNKFSPDTITKDEFEILLAIYYGNVYVINKKAKWIIEEDVFVKDNRYYLAIKALNNFITIDCTKWSNHETRPSNQRRQLLYREYEKYESFCTE